MADLSSEAKTALARAERLYNQLVKRRDEIQELDDYARGKQKLVYASPEWAEFHQGRYKGFADNWCAPVASAACERLALTGFRVDSQKRAAKTLWDDWQRNNGDAQSSQGFLESIIAKRSYTIVWGNNDDEAEFTWEHPSQVIVGYDPGTGEPVDAVKSWIDDDEHEHLTYYTGALIWKFRRKAGVKVNENRTAGGLILLSTSDLTVSGGWGVHQPSTDDEWPLENPFGELNVVEWPNRPMLGNEPISDISGTKAMQDAVNLLWAYLFGGADQASLPGRVVMGQDSPKVPILDAQGQKIGERPVEIKDLKQNRFLWLTGPNAKIDEFSRADLSVFTAVIEVAVAHIAAQTRTPSHYLINSGNVPAAGYELAEAGLVEKVKEFHLFSQAPARQHLRLMALARDNKALANAIRSASLAWENPAVRSDAQMSDALLKKRQTGYPFEYILELDGNSPTDIARIMEMVRREQEDPYLSRLNDKDNADAGAESADVGV